MSDDVFARIEEVNGELVLIDPTAEGVIAAVESHNRKINRQNCLELLKLNLERVKHFKDRAAELKFTGEDVVIVILNVDDPHGKLIADVLMPDQDWQQYRDRGETPVARGLAAREGMVEAVKLINPVEGGRLSRSKELNVIVISSGDVVALEFIGDELL